METEERDATSRASFKCPSCCKTFTDLEVIHFTFMCNLSLSKIRCFMFFLQFLKMLKCDIFCLHGMLLLQADQLFDITTQEFRCTFCREVVEEDQSALPKKDSRLLLAKFNEQLEPLYILLREVEGIKLAPEILEPEPVDLSTIRGFVSYALIL